MSKENNIKKIEGIPETSNYENCLSDKHEQMNLNKFFDVTDTSDNAELEKEWKKHWKGMPDFKQDKQPRFKQLLINFETQSDYEAFALLIQQQLTEKTKSVWYPKREYADNMIQRWILDEDN